MLVLVILTSWTCWLLDLLDVVVILTSWTCWLLDLLLVLVILTSWTLLNLHSRQVERRVRLLKVVLLPACWLTFSSSHLLVSLLNLLVVVQLVFTPKMFVSIM